MLAPTRLTPGGLITGARVVIFTAFVMLFLFTLGPFAASEALLAPWDKAAHFVFLYSLTALALLAFPTVRRGDIAFFIILYALFCEAGQLFLGTEFEVADMIADAGGVMGALAPTYLERLRFYARRAPHRSFAEINALDPRGREEAAALDGLASARRSRRQARGA